MFRLGTKRTLISTISEAGPLAVAAFLALSAFLGGAVSAQGTAALSQEVERLGRVPDSKQIVESLAKTPEASVQLLVEQLHPVDEVEVLASQRMPRTEHVLWCVRALRYITGSKDFCAKTSHKFGPSGEEARRRYWLYFGHSSCVSFFAMWPSRGTDYIAPRDAQLRIIAKWRRWFATDGTSFQYHPLVHPRPEQWLW